MEKSKVIALRQELHHLVAEEKDNTGMNVPLIVAIDHGTTVIDEINSCIMWDDTNGVLYSIELNNDVNDKLYDICPMRVRAFDYISIVSITARCDGNMLMNFFDTKIADNITNDATKEKYRKFLADIRNPRTFAAGWPSPSTSKDLPLQQVERFKDDDVPLMNPSSVMYNLQNNEMNKPEE